MSIFHYRFVSLDGNQAGRADHLAGSYIELPAVEIALDNVAVQLSLGQGPERWSATIKFRWAI